MVVQIFKIFSQIAYEPDWAINSSSLQLFLNALEFNFWNMCSTSTHWCSTQYFHYVPNWYTKHYIWLNKVRFENSEKERQFISGV